MRIAVLLRKAGADGLPLTVACGLGRRYPRLLCCVVAAISYAVALAGCAPDQRQSISTISRKRAVTVSRPAKLPRVQTTGSISPASRTAIPLPDEALLTPQPEPQCEFKTQPGQTDAATERVMKLDYEQQCYRHAEIIVRNRLQLLQVAVGKTIDAVKGREQSSR
jgi:hypothetical protein